MWDLPGPGLAPVSPALAGGFLTPVPRGKPREALFKLLLKIVLEGFPGGAVVESLPANVGDVGLSPGLGGSYMPWSN